MAFDAMVDLEENADLPNIMTSHHDEDVQELWRFDAHKIQITN